MTDAKTARRLDALTKWSRWAAASGHPVPFDDELASIAADSVSWEDNVDSAAVKAWTHAIKHIINQLRMGVTADYILETFSDDLTQPLGPTPEPQLRQSEVNDPPVLQALIAWRQKRMLDQVDGADLIKINTLRRIVNRGYSDIETIGKQLPGTAANLGSEIADIISRFSGSGATSAPAGEPAAARPPTDVVIDQPRPQVQQPVSAPEPRHAAPQPVRSTPEAVVAPARSVVEPTGLLSLTHDDFCEYQYQRPSVDGESLELGQIRVTATDHGRRLSFEPFVPDSGKLVIYRVVSSDGHYPHKPEAGHLVGATTGLSVEDQRPLAQAVRSYQVWCHVGVDRDDAARNNPVLLARGLRVSPVVDLKVHLSDGRVSGEWTTFPGTNRVRVYRIPVDCAAGSDNHQYEICRGESNLEGFTDRDAEPGRSYLYKACAEVPVDGGTQLSDAVEEAVSVPVSLAAVRDMVVAPSSADPGRVDIAWTKPPIGKVRLYRASTRPRADLGQQRDLTKSALQIIEGFREDNRIHGPTDMLDDGKLGMRGVSWPEEWPRVYITPVTELGEQVKVGTTCVETRQLPAVSDAEIVERYDTEMVTFGWPAEAASVLVYRGSTTMAPDEIVERNNPVAEVSRSKYERDGGITFETPLEAKGCTLVLVPVNFSQREAVHGQRTVLEYPGLHRLQYAFTRVGDPNRLIVELHLNNDLDIDSTVALTLVNRPDRLPLSATDGKPVDLLPPGGGERTTQIVFTELKKGPCPTGWRSDWTDSHGFFRLFISSAVDVRRKYALADPPIQALYKQSWPMAPGQAQ